MKLHELNLNIQQPLIQQAIFFYGLFLLVVGFSGVMFADFVSNFYFLVFISGTLGIISLIFCVINPAQIKVYDVLAMTLLLAYGTGTLNTLISFILNHKDLNSISTVSEYWLTRTLGWVVASCGFLHCFGRTDKSSQIFTTNKEIDVPTIDWFLKVSFAFTLIVFYYIYAGKIGYMANTRMSSDSFQVSVLSSLVLSFLLPIGATSFYIARKYSGNETNGNKIKFLLLISIVLLLVQFGLGRRIFVFSVIIYLITEVLVNRPKNILALKNIIYLIFVILIIKVATTAFMTLRVASYQYKTTPSIFKLVPDAIKVYEDRKKLYLEDDINENLSTRTFVLDYLASLTEKSSTIKPLYGQGLFRAFISSVPSAIYHNKYKSKFFLDEEHLFNPHFNLKVTDNAGSILTASVGDFGEVGYFFLPILTCIIISIITKFSVRLNTITTLLISYLILRDVLYVETDFSAYFLLIRNILIFSLLGYFLFTPKKITL